MRTLESAMALFAQVGRCWVATADRSGTPHLATASGMEQLGDGRLRVRYWFCPRTVDNLQHNPRVSVTVWDAGRDTGYQILGRVGRVEDRAYLDGFDPAGDEAATYPSVERVLVVEVDEILAFRHAPHPDEILEDRIGQPSS